MKTIITALTGIFLFLMGFSFVGNDSEGHNGRCTGSAGCTACSNCSRCGHCSAGGTCGVCRGSSSGRSFYSSENSTKSKKTSSKNRNSNSSYSTSPKSNGFYSGSSVSKKKNPVYYYNSNSVLTEENYLYVIGNSINVRKGPGENYAVLEKVIKNQKLIFLSEDGNWLKIVVDATKTEGYVYAKLVR